MSERKSTNHAFILRLWREDDENGGIWRGWIQHVGSGEKRYLHSQEEILAFVHQHTAFGSEAVEEEESLVVGDGKSEG